MTTAIAESLELERRLAAEASPERARAVSEAIPRLAGELERLTEPGEPERIVERALETGPRVTPVEGAAGDGLSEAAGIAALRRW
jgi:hypothetical protein